MLSLRAILLALLINARVIRSANVFKIGVVTVSGGLGQSFLDGLIWWRNKVNENGGLRTGDDPPIVMEVELVSLVVSSPTEAAQKILDFSNGIPEYVHAMVNTFQQFNVAVNDVMAQNQIETVLMHCSGGTPSMYGLEALGIPRWSFQFGVMVPSSDYGTGIFEKVMSFGKRLPNNRVAFLSNVGNAFANFTCRESINRARAAGMEVDNNEIFEFTDADYETALPAAIAALKNSPTKVMMGCTWLADGLKLQQEIIDQRLDLLANIITIAPTNPVWDATFPRDEFGQSLGDYVLSPQQWHHTQNFPDYSSVGNTSTFAAEFYANNSRYPDYLLASCTAAGVILERAISKVLMGTFLLPDSPTSSCGGTNCFEERLRLMIRDFDEDTMYGRVRFSRYNQNIGHEAAVVQMLPPMGQVAVLPAATAQSSLYFPAPTWEERDSCNATQCAEPPVFRIGVISPDTEEGRNISLGLEWWRDKVNAAGGIKTQNGIYLKVELIWKNTTQNGEPNNQIARAETSNFINRLTDPVQAMVNTYYGHTVAVNTEMKEENIVKVLLHCTGGVPSWYGGPDADGQPKPRSIYQFGIPIPTTNYADSIFNFVSKRLDSPDTIPDAMGGNSRKIVFFRNVENEITDYTCGMAISQAVASGFQIFETLPYNVSDVTYVTKMEGLADRMKQNDVRMSFGCTWVEDGIELQKVLTRKMVDLHLNVVWSAPKTREWLQAFPPDAQGLSDGDYVMCPTAWHHTQYFSDLSSVGNSTFFAGEYKDAIGEYPDTKVAQCAAAGVVLEKAMAGIVWNGVQQFDDTDFRVAIRDIRVDTFFGEVRFDNLNQNVGHDPAVIQVFPGTADNPNTIRTSVLPETNSQSNLKFPAPTWEWRNGCKEPSRPNGESGLFCEPEVATDDGTMQYVIIIYVAVPLLFLCALYFSRMFQGVIRRRRSKYVQKWNEELEKALWDQDVVAAKEAENKLRPFKGKNMFGFSYPVKNAAEVAKEQSLQAGIGVLYLLSDDFMKVVKASCGENIRDPTFHDLKKNFFMRDNWNGMEDFFFYKSFNMICPRDGQKGVALTDAFSREFRQKQTHFLSWSWAYTIRQVRSGLDFWIHSTLIDPSDAFLFMCFFVNNQHRILVSGQQTGSDELDRIFEGNLVRIGRMIALLDNWRKPVYLTRIWTIFEQNVAVTNQIEVKIILPRDAEANLFMTISTGTEGIKSVKDSLCTVNSATADAWSPQDKEAIQAKILAGCGFEEINEHVRQVMIAWIGNVVIGAMQRVVKGEDVLASAHKWASTSSYISEHRDFAEDLDTLQHVRSLL